MDGKEKAIVILVACLLTVLGMLLIMVSARDFGIRTTGDNEIIIEGLDDSGTNMNGKTYHEGNMQIDGNFSFSDFLVENVWAVQFNGTMVRPTCDSSTRGTLIFIANRAGMADTVGVCMKNALDLYVWSSIV